MGRFGIGKSGNLLVSQTDDGGGGRRAVSLVDTLQVDDAAVGEAVLQDVVLHDGVVAMGVDADVRFAREAVVHDAAEDAVYVRIACHAMNDMIGQGIVEPFAVVNGAIGGLGRREESEVGHNLAVVYDDECTIAVDVGRDDGFRRVVASPLLVVA